jgi:N-acetylmuramoyl-L-alanine amidase
MLIFMMILTLMTPKEFDYLCRTVEAEAGICGYEEKVLVADVILNRVESTDFPSTITEVIEQPHQFQVYANDRVLEVEVTYDTIRAVKTSIRGDKRSESLYFCNYEIIDDSKKAWFDELELITSMEYMNYYK